MCRPMIRAIAAGVAMMCCALPAPPARANDRETRPVLATDAPAPMISPHAGLDFSPAADDTLGFVSATDVTISSAPAYLTSATLDSPAAPPSASATAIPLPPAAWTGFASLAGLGTIALLRHLRRDR